MNEDRLRAAMVKGSRAKELLEDEILSQCFDALHQDLVQAWSLALDPEERERIWCKQAVLGEVRQKLMSLIANGNVARRQLQN